MTRIRMLFILAIVWLAVLNCNAQTFKQLTDSATVAGNRKHYLQAIELYNQALRLDKENYFIYDRLAKMYYFLNNLDSSIVYCDLALKKNPNDTMALFQRGHCFFDKRQFRNAQDDFIAAFEGTGKRNADDCFNIGNCYKALRDYEKAIEYFKLTLTLDPNDKYSLYETGYCYASLQAPEKDSALMYYNKAIEKDSNYYDPYFNRGLLYAVQFKDLKSAHADLEKSIAIRPKNKYSYLYNGMLYRDEKEFAKAKDMYDKVLDLYPDFSDAYFERALAWYGIGVLNMVCKDLDIAQKLGNAQAIEYKKKICK